MTRVLLVAAHPDDETIGASSVLSAGSEVLVLHATDGVPIDAHFMPERFVARSDEYKAIRRWELLQALALVPAPLHAVSIGARDQGAVFALSTLTTAVADAIRSFAPETIVCHALEGGHPDHDAVALATWCAVRRTARAGGRVPRVQEMGVYHAAPPSGDAHDEMSFGPLTWCNLMPSRDPAAVVIHLDDEQRTRKRSMLACYSSQAAVLADVPDDRECLRTLSREHLLASDLFARTLGGRPHDGPLWYERLHFDLNWNRFVKAARSELDRMGEGW